MKKPMELFEIKEEYKDNPSLIRKQIIEEFPKFYDACKEAGKLWRMFSPSQLGNARFERDYGMSETEYAMYYYHNRGQKLTGQRRKLSISKLDDI